MIQIGDIVVDFRDPVQLGLALVGAILIVLIIVMLRASRNNDDPMAPVARQIAGLNDTVRTLSAGQQQLLGGLNTVSNTQSETHAKLIQTMEARLAEVQKGLTDSLHGSTVKTTRSLTELQERLKTIDKAQDNIEKLSGDVLSLQDILSNKQTRGAFGEIQLYDIVGKALPKDSYSTQATLSNGKRPDCLIHLPNPPGPIVVDAKFPLEAYEALRRAEPKSAQMLEAQRAMKTAVRTHIRAISE